jgi:hypothetical protein
MSAPMSFLAMVLRRAKSVVDSVKVKRQSTGLATSQFSLTVLSNSNPLAHIIHDNDANVMQDP